VPVVGAVGGRDRERDFVGHFQRMATGHFIVRRLERAHGWEEVRRAYANLDAPPDRVPRGLPPPRIGTELPRTRREPLAPHRTRIGSPRLHGRILARAYPRQPSSTGI
jgi:hypothetical protein